MELYSGRCVNAMDILSSDIDIKDIAHALALQCRFKGHCKQFYSIAQHSVLVARHLQARSILQLFGLLHDAAEAYLGDMISPLKDMLPEYKTQERYLQDKIYYHFTGRRPTHPEITEIKLIDTRLLLSEARVLMPSGGDGWRPGIEPLDLVITPVSASIAEAGFFYAFHKLREGRCI